jgi:hypothetical protein
VAWGVLDARCVGEALGVARPVGAPVGLSLTTWTWAGCNGTRALSDGLEVSPITAGSRAITAKPPKRMAFFTAASARALENTSP